MTQYQVPQFIDIEDRIIGPLTLKQFLYLAFAGAILFVLWFILNFYFWLVLAIPIIALSSAFAFLKINDRPFVYFFLSFINYYLKPKLYIFSAAHLETKRECPAKAPEETVASKVPPQKVTRSKLKELALSLDTRK